MNSLIGRYGQKYFIKKKSEMRFDTMKKWASNSRAVSIRRSATLEDAEAHIESIYAHELLSIKLEKQRELRDNLRASLKIIQGEKNYLRVSTPIAQLRVIKGEAS